MIYYIYRIVNRKNGKCYVGWSGNPIKRWKTHLYAVKSGKLARYKLHHAMKKEGVENFSFEILYCSKDDRYIITEMESYFIEQYNSLHEGYNSTRGGQGNNGWVPSDETRTLWRKQRKNKIFTKEHRRKLSIAAKANPRMHNPESRKKLSETLKKRGIRPIMTEEQREQKRLNQIGKPIHSQEWKEELSKRFKHNNPMHDPVKREKARRNKKGKGVGEKNGRAVFAKIYDPEGTLVGQGYLRGLCDKHGYPYSKFLKNSRTSNPLVRGEWKNWNIIQIAKPNLDSSIH